MSELLGEVSFFDVIITFFILIFAIKGAIGGFINELSKLFGWIVGIFVSVRFGSAFGEFLNQYFEIGGKAAYSVAGFIAILSLFLLSIYLINTLLTNVAKSFSTLNFVNKFLGFVFGGGKIFLILSIIIGALYAIPLTRTHLFDNYMKEEKIIFPLMVKVGTYILNLESKKEEKDDKLKKIKEEIIK